MLPMTLRSGGMFLGRGSQVFCNERRNLIVCIQGPLVALGWDFWCCSKVTGSEPQKMSDNNFICDLPLIESLKDLLHRVWKKERQNLEEDIDEAKSANVDPAQRVFTRIRQKLHL